MNTKLGFATMASALLVGAATHAADTRHYDCTKPGNANKAACKAATPAAAATAPSPVVAKAPTAAATTPASTKHYDCTKAGNAKKAVCKGVAAAQAPVSSAPASTPMFRPAPPSSAVASPARPPTSEPSLTTPAGSPRIVAWTEKNGKVVHYDCSKAGNLTKKACKQ